MDKKKKELRRLSRIHLRGIRKLVLAWNPLGIPGVPEDEYSTIEMWLYRKLIDDVSIAELEACLYDWQCGFLGGFADTSGESPLSPPRRSHHGLVGATTEIMVHYAH